MCRAQLLTKQACNASTQSHFNRSNPATYQDTPHKCVWQDTSAAAAAAGGGGGSQAQQGGQCVAVTPDIWCSDPKQREDIFHGGSPVPPGASAKVKCEALPSVFSGLCRYSNGSAAAAPAASTAAAAAAAAAAAGNAGGHCVATECADLTTVQDCGRYSTKKKTEISCVWDSTKETCLEYGGNCTVLPDSSTCVAEKGCFWGATNVSHGEAICHAGKGHVMPGIQGGESFNCSFEHWKYPVRKRLLLVEEFSLCFVPGLSWQFDPFF